MNWKRNEGLTLVELMVAILVAAIITTAATTIMLLGLRVNRHSTNTAQTQYTARTVLTVLENLASEGTVDKVYATPDAWKIVSVETDNGTETENILLSYDATTKIIYTGTTVPMLENVVASNVVFKDGLLTFAIETADGSYTSSVYCRTFGDDPVEDDELESLKNPVDTSASRKAFLAALLSQYDSVGGVIQYVADGSIVYDATEKETYRFFSQWYIGGYDNNNADSSWNYRTPWCACFISWALCHYNDPSGQIKPQNGSSKWYANVETFKNNYFDSKLEDGLWKEQTADGRSDIIPGDLIFFDWENDGSLDHIGAVLKAEPDDTYIYTIEGNSANTVAIRKYEKTDERIAGYGVLWPSTPSQ